MISMEAIKEGKNMTLYEIDNNIRAFLDKMLDAVDEETGEVLEVDPAELEQLNEAREQKMENIALYIKNLEADAKAIKEEENNLKERREKAEKKAERLRNLLAMSMNSAEESKFNTARCAVSFRFSKSVVITDLDLIDEAYVKKTIDVKPDKVAIKQAIEAGEDVEGAYLEEKQNIQIK